MRSAKVTYSDGTIINTSLAAHLTDKEINEYFKIGKVFNISNDPDDNLQTVVNCEIEPLKGLICEVFRPVNRIDCTNGGLSSEVNSILLTGPGIPEIFNASPDCPAFKVVRRSIYPGGAQYIHFEPWERPTGFGWMYGGYHCYTSDSRFPLPADGFD